MRGKLNEFFTPGDHYDRLYGYKFNYNWMANQKSAEYNMKGTCFLRSYTAVNFYGA